MRLSLIVILNFALCMMYILCGCQQGKEKQLTTSDHTHKKLNTATIGSRKDSIQQKVFYNYFILLGQSAEKKEGYTQQQMDSLEKIISLRKKF